MRYLVFCAFVALAVLAPARLHAQGVRCRDGTTWTPSKGVVACANHSGVVGVRRTRFKAAKSARTRRVITCKDNTTTNAPGANPCAGHGGVNKGSQTHSAPPIRRSQ